ncbi:DNA polymerase II [Shewanella sp. YIC-542]|uniref:DNA polymerase II n=1 Tax=Shewanella mytili TaxID=3377111 RepID=UPI00398F8D2A
MPSSGCTTVKGRILTRQTLTSDTGMCLRYCLKTPDGPVTVDMPDVAQMAFVPQSAQTQLCQRFPAIVWRNLSLQDFQQQPMAAVYCHNRKLFRQLQTWANARHIALHEADIRPHQRYLIERFIALDVEFQGVFADDAQTRFVASKARSAVLADVPLRVVSLDVECSADGELYSVGLYGEDEQGTLLRKVFMVGACQPETAWIEWVADERQLLLAVVDWFAGWQPDVLLGWSVVTFDLALLSKRFAWHRIPAAIGRNGALLAWLVADKFRPETLLLPGIVVLDGIDWLKAAFYKFERYTLQYVAQQLLSEGKLIHDANNRLDEITRLFQEDKLALAQYNLQDCRLVWDIFQRTHLLAFAIARAQLTGLEFGRVGASVAAFNHLYLPHLHRAGYVAPAAPLSDGLESPGGYVMDSVPGLYRDIIVLDFKSLYPSIIRTFLIDPLGLVLGRQQPENRTVPGYLGAQFSRTGHILPTLVAKLAEAREQAKQQADAPLSQAIKIIMNSLYGVLGSRGCVFHDARLASSITMRGHWIMQQTKAWIEAQGLCVIYGDTDSTFVWLGKQHDIQNPEAFGRALAANITERWQQYIQQHFALESALELEFDNHYQHFLMPTLRGSAQGSKKRYVGAIPQADGTLQLVFKGMEQVRSDWSPLAKRIQYELYQRLFNGGDVKAYLTTQITLLQQGALDGELVFSKRLRRALAAYKAHAPHVKAAQRLITGLQNPDYGKKGARIEYVITSNGPEPVLLSHGTPDYQYYLEKQIRPVAEPVLTQLQLSFEQIAIKQISLI